MKIKYINYTWTLCNEDKNGILDAPKSGHVYIITVNVIKTKETKLLYIGATKNLRTRLMSHSLIQILKANRGTIFTISVLYKKFSRCFYENRKGNFAKEKQLILQYTPPFNSYKGSKKVKAFGMRVFWNSVGITNINFTTNKK